MPILKLYHKAFFLSIFPALMVPYLSNAIEFNDTVINQIAASYNYADSSKAINRYKLRSKTTSKVIYGTAIKKIKFKGFPCTKLSIRLNIAVKGYQPKKTGVECGGLVVKPNELTFESLTTTVTGVGECKSVVNNAGIFTFKHSGRFGSSEKVRKEVFCVNLSKTE